MAPRHPARIARQRVASRNTPRPRAFPARRPSSPSCRGVQKSRHRNSRPVVDHIRRASFLRPPAHRAGTDLTPSALDQRRPPVLEPNNEASGTLDCSVGGGPSSTTSDGPSFFCRPHARPETSHPPPRLETRRPQRTGVCQGTVKEEGGPFHMHRLLFAAAAIAAIAALAASRINGQLFTDDPAHRQCVATGHIPGTPLYLQCRGRVVQGGAAEYQEAVAR